MRISISRRSWRFAPSRPNARGSRKWKLAREVDQVAWLLGINFTIQVVTPEGASVFHVLGGQSDTVGRRCRSCIPLSSASRAVVTVR